MSSAAGIGGSYSTYELGLNDDTNGRVTAFTAGKITINGGTVNTYGDDVGIGSLTEVSSEKTVITINGGNVYARARDLGAGIGVGRAVDISRNRTNNSTIIITGGTVAAQGGSDAAGIGGGRFRDSGTIKIKAGLYSKKFCTAPRNV